jgi:hypothetical protein
VRTRTRQPGESELLRPRDYRVAAPARIRKPPSPAIVLLVGFAVLILAGTPRRS